MIYTDQMGRQVELFHPPVRIVSTVPSQTELLFDLGLKERITGITKFCIHPKADIQDIPKIGGTKQLNLDLIKEIRPDLIIANKEENERSQIEELMKEFPVWISDIFNLNDSLEMIRSVGQLTGAESQADVIVRKIGKGFRFQPLLLPLKALYFIWRKPYMVAGRDTFINDMLKQCGVVNAARGYRYPELTAEAIQEISPDIILLSSEPYPFGEKHIEEFKALLPKVPVYLVDGEMFSWYGSRLIHAPAYFNSLIASIRHDLHFES